MSGISKKTMGFVQSLKASDDFEWQIALLIKSRMQLPVSTKYLLGPDLLLPHGCHTSQYVKIEGSHKN